MTLTKMKMKGMKLHFPRVAALLNISKTKYQFWIKMWKNFLGAFNSIILRLNLINGVLIGTTNVSTQYSAILTSREKKYSITVAAFCLKQRKKKKKKKA